MNLASEQTPPDGTSLSLEQQVVRLQALLEASRLVHSTIDLNRVLQQAARIAVLELEMEGALFTEPGISFGEIPLDALASTAPPFPRFPLLGRDGALISELVIITPEARELTLYENDFIEGLVLQTAVAAENAVNHNRHLEYARVAQDLEAARAIQRSLIPETMPSIPGYSLAARSDACYQVGGDYLDVVTRPDGSPLIVVADVAGKGLASALVCTAFRSAFRALAHQKLTLEELSCRLSQQHWDEGSEARRRYVTAIFLRLDPETGELEFLNAGHNPAILVLPGQHAPRVVGASGVPLGMLPGTQYTTERLDFPPGARLLLYTDGLTEVFKEEEEFGTDRLIDAFRATDNLSAGATLNSLWSTLNNFTGAAPQQDDMTAVTMSRLTSKDQEKA